MRHLVFAFLILVPGLSNATENPWYTQGKFEPSQRLEFTLSNNLAIDRKNTPVIIRREDFPVPESE